MDDVTTEPTVALGFELNGRRFEREVPVRRTLADVLRDDAGSTGTHLGCEHGVCGACTVLVDGRSVRSCIMLAAQAQGRDVTTIEGLSPPSGLSPLQQALSDHGGLQCGFCTPGFVVAATELLRDDPRADEACVRSALSGNLCRCTGYEGIVDAVLAARDLEVEAPPVVTRASATPSAVPPPVGETAGDTASSPATTPDPAAPRAGRNRVIAAGLALSAVVAVAVAATRRRRAPHRIGTAR